MSTLNLDAASRLDIICRKGDTFSMNLNLSNASGTVVNASAYSYKMEVRDTDTATGTVIASGVSLYRGILLGLYRLVRLLLLWLLFLGGCMSMTFRLLQRGLVLSRRGFMGRSRLMRM